MNGRKLVLFSALVTGAVILGFPSRAHACCNVIPVVQSWYQSAAGKVSAPIAGPQTLVTIKLECVPSGFPTIFSPDQTYGVKLFFGGSDGARGPDFELDPGDVWLLNNTTLRFRVPDTTSEYPQDGRAGPTEIQVLEKDSGTLMAQIWQLFRASDVCETLPSGQVAGSSPPPSVLPDQREPVFGTFTILPRSYDLAAVSSSSPPKLLTTVDGHGNLLIPLNHFGLLPDPTGSESAGTPVAVFENAYGIFAAFPDDKGRCKESWLPCNGPCESGTGPCLKEIKQFLEVAHEEGRGGEAVRLFTADGRPLPPLVQVDENGHLFGTADYPEAVLRVARTVEIGGSPRQLHDIQGRAELSQGKPFIIDSTKHTFKKKCTHPIPLIGLRRSDHVWGYVRDETLNAEDESLNQDKDLWDRVVQVHETRDGGLNCSENTQKAVTERTVTGLSHPVIEVGESLVAFLQSEESTGQDLDGDSMVEADVDVLRVTDSKGKRIKTYLRSDLTNEESTAGLKSLAFSADGNFIASCTETVAACKKKPAFGRRSLVISRRVVGATTDKPLVFFRKKGSTPQLEVLEINETTTGKKGIFRSVNIGANVVAVANGHAVFLQDHPGDQEKAFLYHGHDGKVVEDLNLAAAPKGDLLIAISDAVVAVASQSGSVDLKFRNLDPEGSAFSPINLPAKAMGVMGETVVFITPATAIGTPSASGGPLRRYDLGNSVSEDLLHNATDLVLGDGLVAFRNYDPGKAVYNMYVYEIATENFYETGQTAIEAAEPGLEWMSPYGVSDRNLYFLTNEVEQGYDLDGDGQAYDTVLQIINVDSLDAQLVMAVADTLDVASTELTDVAPEPVGLGSYSPSPQLVILDEVDGRPLLRVTTNRRIDGNPFVAAMGDIDTDGLFDVVDLCPEEWNPKQIDLDLDRLGDGACDTGYCSGFTPPSPPLLAKRKAKAQKQMARAALEYIRTRTEVVGECLGSFFSGSRRGDATAWCRGRFVNGVEILPGDPETSGTLAEAADKLTRKLYKCCSWCSDSIGFFDEVGKTASSLSRQILETSGEAVNAVTMLSYRDRDRRPGIFPCLRTVGEASTELLVDYVEMMEECLDRRSPDVETRRYDDSALCLGRYEWPLRSSAEASQPPEIRFVPPLDRGANRAITKAIDEFKEAVSDDVCWHNGQSILAQLGVCDIGDQTRNRDKARKPEKPRGSQAPEETRCVECVAWRRAVEVIRSIYGPEVEQPAPYGAHLARSSKLP